MAITGISAISGEQIIAVGAVSAREAASATFTINGNSLQGLYDTVSNNSGSWTGGSTYTGDAQGALDEVYSNSGTWNSTYTTVSSNSATWGQGSGGAVIPYNAADPEATYNALVAAWDGSTPVYLSRTQNDKTYIVQVLDFVDGQGYMESYFEFASVQNYYDGEGKLRTINGLVRYNPNYLTNQYDCTWTTSDIAALSYPAYSDSGKVFTVDEFGRPAWQTPQGGELPQSATEAIDVVTGGSANWNGTTETVSSNSASWGGSALPISAGPGIKLEMVNNTLVASTDETVLWSGNLSAVDNAKLTASEDPLNFQMLDIYMNGFNDGLRATEVFRFVSTNREYCLAPQAFQGLTQRLNHVRFQFNGLVGTTSGTIQYLVDTNGVRTAADRPAIVKIVGINRIAGGN